MEHNDPDYQAYLVRLWRVAGQEQPTWRASVEDVHTGERRGFVDLEALHTFLVKRTLNHEMEAGDPLNHD